MFGSEEAWERITTVVMVTHFDEDNLFVLGWTLENDLIVVIHGKDHNLVVGEMTLKGIEFGQSTRPFGYTDGVLGLDVFEGVCHALSCRSRGDDFRDRNRLSWSR